jgi:hypothetical protein
MAWFLNFYKCARCKRIWADQWSATCDDDCPHCGARHMSPFDSERLTTLIETARSLLCTGRRTPPSMIRIIANLAAFRRASRRSSFYPLTVIDADSVSRTRCGILYAAPQSRDPGFKWTYTGTPA